MADVRAPPLPEEYEAMFADTVKDIKEIVMKIRDEKRSKFSVPGYNIPSLTNSGGRSRETVDMIVPANKAGLIIGSHGDTLRRMEKQAQVKMQFDQQWQGGENERRIIITGFPEDIEEARRLIVEKITEDRDFRGSGGRNYETVQMMIPNSKIGLVIGRGGETVKDLQERSGAKVFVNQDVKNDANPNEKPVTISGDPEAIKIAQTLISDILRGGPAGSASGLPTLTIQIPEATVGAVMGKKADILKSIIAASGGIKIFIEHSNIPGTQNREVQFTGPMEHCNYAAYLVQERVNSYYSGNGSGESYSAYGSVSASNDAYASYTDQTQGAAYDYSQYYQQQQQQQQQQPTEMDPAAIAAYYAQYYASVAAYDPNYVNPSSDPSNANK